MTSEVQTVSWKALEAKLGRKLKVGDEFTTIVGYWRVLDTNKDGKDLYVVEKIG
jgi:hypothetical protein